MLDELGFCFALISSLIGIILLYDAVSGSDPAQAAKLVGGAFLFALGLVIFALVARDWWQWKKDRKEAGRSVPD
jgi:uncharacterized membrane protein YdjX (TVP38/TMEM64 family)